MAKSNQPPNQGALTPNSDELAEMRQAIALLINQIRLNELLIAQNEEIERVKELQAQSDDLVAKLNELEETQQMLEEDTAQQIIRMEENLEQKRARLEADYQEEVEEIVQKAIQEHSLLDEFPRAFLMLLADLPGILGFSLLYLAGNSLSNGSLSLTTDQITNSLILGSRTSAAISGPLATIMLLSLCADSNQLDENVPKQELKSFSLCILNHAITNFLTCSAISSGNYSCALAFQIAKFSIDVATSRFETIEKYKQLADKSISNVLNRP